MTPSPGEICIAVVASALLMSVVTCERQIPGAA